jgi:hypothetical protein
MDQVPTSCQRVVHPLRSAVRPKGATSVADYAHCHGSSHFELPVIGMPCPGASWLLCLVPLGMLSAGPLSCSNMHCRSRTPGQRLDCLATVAAKQAAPDTTCRHATPLMSIRFHDTAAILVPCISVPQHHQPLARASQVMHPTVMRARPSSITAPSTCSSHRHCKQVQSTQTRLV